MKKSFKLAILLGCFALLGLLLLITGPWLRTAGTAQTPDQATLPQQSAEKLSQAEVSSQPASELESPPDTSAGPAPLAAPREDSSIFERFNEWAARYLAASEEQRRGLLNEGIQIAQIRRAELRLLIEADPRQAIEYAVPPVLRQQLPPALAELLEERVNEKGFYGVLGAVPSAENPETPAYRREVRTSDGGHYRAFVYGRRLSQPTTEDASIVGIAVDDAMALDERPLRVVASGEILNHPNNLTRRRTVTLIDEKGFTSGREVLTTPATPRDVVETCPVSGQVTEPSRTEDSGAVTANDIVVEAGGQFHYLCRGGHIIAFEEKLLSREGGNGGPVMPTSPPSATQSTGYKTHLLMRVAFPEALKGSVTEKDGHDLGKNVQDWFLNSSYGAMTFMTTVSPLIILPRSEAWYKDQDTSGSAYEVLADARTAAKAAGFDPANFNFDTVIYTGTPGSFGGQAYVGGKGCWLKSGTGTGVACHEYGHNFGLWHANFWSTTNGSAIGGGSHVEYGDNFDTMGSASAGDLQFNACHKNMLSWLPNALVHDVTTSGTYRIHQMDQPAQNPRLRYAIKTRKDADRDYWVDLRQLFASNTWVQGGVFLHWSPWATSEGGSHLLDTTPGSIDGKNDAPIVIGRTFSDPETGIHITPIAKNATTPPSADVVVNLGMFPGNTTPVVAVGASATSAATNVAINFTATAEDLDGDVLSYAWDFGDKSFSTTNSPTVSKSWSAAGEYRVRCTVSDMKGKTASASVIVTIGSPGTFRIAGTITAAGQPLANVRVHNSLTGSSYREAYTDADGTYTLTRLAAGTYTVATQLYGYTLTPAGSASVSVGPNASNVNFTAAKQPQVSIALQDADCAEGANTGTFRISRTGSTAAALAVSLYAPSGTATRNTDYTLTPGITSATPFQTLTIPAGQAFLDVLVTALDDSGVESFESAIIELVPSTSYVIGAATTTLWIGDADTANQLVRLRVADRDVDESGDGGQFLIERFGATAASLNVSVALSGTASNGTDYASIPTTITIPAGSSSVPINVTPLQDTGVEVMETVILTINTNAAYTRAASTADYVGTVNLHDDDQPVVTVVATDSAASESGNDPGVFTITRTGSTAAALTVNYGLTGGALHGTDYVPLPGVLTFPAGSAVATVVITPINDSIGEPAQTAVLQLRGGTGYTIGAASNATVTINDDSDAPYASIAVTTGPAIEGGTAGVFRVTTTGTGSGNISVLYTVTGTATNGTDFTFLNGSLSMARNATSNLTISTLQDALAEGYETVTVTLTPDPAYSLALDASATLNLQDDDAPQVNVSTTDDTFSETNASVAKFFISRTGATTNALTVNYTLGGTATAGVDYTAPGGSVTIAAGAAGAFVNVSMLDDSLAEGTETIVLSVIPDAGYAIGNGSATRYISDAESTSVSTQVRFSAGSSSVAENAGTINIPVTLNLAAASDVTVEYFINGGTALGAGIDYALAPGLLTFLAGETSKNIQVVISDDSLDEADATLVISLANPNNAKLGTSSHTLTITDNDAPPGVTVGFAGTAGSGLESQSPAPLIVALNTAQGSAVTVDYAVTGGTATAGADYTITSGTLAFAAGETVKTIPNTIVDDASVESGETIILTLSNPVGAILSANPVYTHTITDDDTATVTVLATDADAAEPGTNTGLFTVTRTGPTTAALTVNFNISGTATSGADYANLANTVVIAAGASSATVLVTPLNDTVVDPAKTVILSLTPGVYTIGAENSATVTIADDDVDMIITIVASDASAVESGDPGAFTVTRDGSTLEALTVNLGITGTATAGGDYTALATSVVIPALADSVIIPVSPLTDSLNEGDETVILTVLAGAGYSRGTPVSATVTIANTDDGSPPTLAPNDIVDNKGGSSVFINTLVTYSVTFNKDMDASTVTAADFGNAGSASVTIGSVTETTPTSGIFTVQAMPTNAGTLQLKINAAADLKSAAGISLDTTSAIADNTVITVAGTAPTLADALDTTGLIWITSGNANWIYQTTTRHDGVDAAQSGVIDHDQSTAIETTLTGPGDLTFWWKVSSETGYDYLRFHLDGIEQIGSLAKISGTVDWVQKTVAIPAGNHTVQWSYTKDESVVVGSDAAWVDQVVYTTSAAPEIAVEQPVGTDLADGGVAINFGAINLPDSSTPITFTVKNTGTADLTGLSLSKDGGHNTDFALGSLGATTLVPGASTTFDVTFTPGAVGTRTAAIHLASNDANENPFDISLTGTGIGPGTLEVTPAGNLASSGYYGGSFSPSSLLYTLNNPGNTPIDWTVAKISPWVNLSATSGTLAAGTNTTVTVSINDNAETLAVAVYTDTVTFTNTTNGSGDTTRGVSLNVTPRPATVTLGNLSHIYDNSPKSASVTTNPPDLDHSVTYAGSASPPTNAGTYAVVATVTDSNYSGSASGSLVIGKASQTINFAALNPALDNAPPFALTATASSGLAVSFASSNPAVATVSGNTVTIVGLGTATITASQVGDTNYNAATSVPQPLTVVRSNPLAVTGGPYSVLIGQSVSLNANASQPSYNETITSYEWDLNMDGDFSDVPLATAEISYDILKTTWSREPGPNTIQLKVTDSSGKTSITSTTLTLIATLNWDANTATNGAQDGTGAWLTANQWWTGSANTTWSSSANAIFGSGGAGGAVTLASPTTANSITFSSFTGTYTLGTAAQTITLNGGITKNSGSAAATIISPITLGAAQSWINSSTGLLTVGTGAVTNGGFLLTIDGTGNTTVSSAISGGGGLTKTGTGKLILNAVPASPNNYSGPTRVLGGILQIGAIYQNADSSIPGGFTGTPVTGSNLEINGGIVALTYTMGRALGTGPGQVQITGGRSGFAMLVDPRNTWTVGGSSANEVVWGASGEGPALGYFNPSTFVMNDSAAGGTEHFILNNKVDLNGANRTIETANSNTASYGEISGVIRNTNTSVAAGIIKTGLGELKLSATNTYDGATVINAGILDATTFANINTNSSIGKGSVAGSAADLVLNGGTLRHSAANVATTNRLFSVGTSGGGIDSSAALETNTLSFTATGAFGFIGTGTRTLTLGGSNTGNNTIALLIGDDGANATSLAKTGTGTWILSNPGNNYTGATTLAGGSLQGFIPGGIATTGGTSALIFNGGVLGLTGDFTRSLDTASTVTAANFTGAGGWAAYGADRNVNLGGASAQIVWATPDTGFNAKTLILGAASATHKVTLQNGLDLGTAVRTVQTDDGTGLVDGELSGIITGGAGGGLTKTGNGVLSLSNTNTYVGVTTVSAGVLRLDSAGALPGGIGTTGGTSNLTFNGGVLGLNTGDFTRSLNTAATATAATFSGAGGWAAYGADRIVNLGGASASITWATANTGFNGQTLILGHATATHMVDLQNPLALGNAARTVQVDNGTATVDANLSGAISGTGGSIKKTGAGTLLISGNMSQTGGLELNGGVLRLSGTNTYSGNTNFSSAGVQLIFAGTQAISPNSAYVMNTNASTSDSSVKLLDDTGGVNNSLVTATGSTFTIQNNNSPGNAHTFIVGNNNTANGGTSSGTTTGSTIAFGTLNWNTYAAGTTAYGPINIQGTNGYSLQINSVVLHNAANLTSPAVGNTFFTPTTANVILGTVTVGTGNTGQGYQTLVLDGTSSDNRVTGAISNASDVGTSNRPLRVTKSNTSTWTLSGNNSYTGATTITGGVLRITHASALGSTTTGSTQSGTSALEIDGTGGAVVVGAETLGINGGGISNGGALRNITGDNTYGGTITLAAQSRINSDSGTLLLNNAAAFTGAGQTLVVGGAGNITISGAITTTTGALTKDGAGTLLLYGNNTYTGLTTVSTGKLFVHGDQTSATGAVSVSANATLGGTGIIGGSTTIAANGKLEFDLSTAPESHDKLELATGKTLNFSGAAVLTITSSGGASDGDYTLVSAPGGIGALPTFALNLPAGWAATVSKVDNNLVLSLTVPDITPPTLTDITDDKSGAPVDANTLVTYTISFSEDINHATVTAADFGNAGTSSFTIGTVSETTPGEFSVQATPTTPGSLQLQVNADADLTDNAGNALNTNAAITDATVITVNPLMTTVPDVVGIAQAAAESNIAAANLVVGAVATQNHFTIPAGSVISQNPTGGASVVQNSAVDLVVSLGPPTYTVSYIANSATSGTAPTSQTKTHDVDLTLAANSGGLLRTGYTFAGWNTAADGTGVDYAAGGTYTANTPQILHAKWTLNTVAAVTNTSSLSVAEGGSDTFQVKLSAEPVASVAITVSRTSGDPDITLQSGSSLTFTSANWNAYQTVTLAAAEDDGDNTAGSATITCSGVDITPAIVTASEIDDDHVLSAAASNGSITKNPDTPYHDRDSTVQLTAAPDAGHHFTAWSGDASGSDNPLTVIMSADKSVTANFTANALTLTINSVGISEAAGSAATTATVTRNSGTTGALTVSLSSSDPSEATVPTSVEIPDGQTSAIFSIHAINDEIVDGLQTVDITATATGHTSATDTIDVTDDDTPTLTLVIAADSISEAGGAAATTATVTRNTNTAGALMVNLASSDLTEVTVPASVIIPEAQTSASFSLNAIDDMIVDGTQTVTITASDSGHASGNDTIDVTDDENLTHTVSFDTTGGSAASPTSKLVTYDAAYGELATTTRTGYTFNGWFTAPTGGIEVTSATIVSATADHVLYAQWTANTHTATFESNGGDAASPMSKLVTYDAAYGELAATTRTGHTFNGWFTAPTGGTEVTSATTVSATADHTLYAQWTANTHTVSFDANGGDAASPMSKLVTYDAAYGELATTTRTGYTFNGWFTAATGGTLVTAATTVAITADQTLHAQWTANTYTVTFDSNGGDIASPTSKLVTYDAAYGELATATRTGYTFDGWFTADTGGTLVTATTTVAITADQTLYAQWTANTHTVTFDSNGGDAASPISKLVTYDAAYADLATTTRTGYTFNGWFTAPTGGTEVTSATIVTAAADHVLYAQWTANTHTLTYTAGTGGSITGTTTQTVNHEANGTQVTAVPASGHLFVKWSDDVMTASRTDTNVTADLTVTAVFAMNPYTAWASGTFANAFTDTAPASDPDGDKLTNLQEYAFGTDPTVSSTGPVAYSGGVVTTHGQPVLIDQGGTRHAVFGRRVDHAAAGLTYAVRFSADLEPGYWNTSSAVPTVIATDGVIEVVRVPYPGPIASSSGPKIPRFFQVAVTGN